MITVTPVAAKQIATAARQGGTEGMPLRLAAEKKDDGSLNYLMGFDEAKDGDERISTEGVDVVIDPSYQSLLEGTVLDFVEMEDGDFRFIFLNPNDANYKPAEKAN